MVTFEDLRFVPHPIFAGIQARFEFENGYGVSVVRAEITYGAKNGLYELAVTVDRQPVQDTPITDDVLGWLTPDAVTRHMQQVAALPPRDTGQ